MGPICLLTVKGGNPHHLPLERLEALQDLVQTLGAEAYPRFVRLGAASKLSLQPVGSGELLAEVRHFAVRLQEATVPCLLFRDAGGALLGGLYAAGGTGGRTGPGPGSIAIAPTESGIRAETTLFPPPAGFRSRPALASGHYECYFQRIEWQGGECIGWRTAAMGGPDRPVSLSPLYLPPVTRWDFAHVNGKPDVVAVELALIPFETAFQEILHGLRSACEDSLRLKAPLHVRRE